MLAHLAGEMNKLLRIVGAANDSKDSTLRPYTPPPLGSNFMHTLHAHIFSFLQGTEIDITGAIPNPDIQVSQRQRLQGDSGVRGQEEAREFKVAPWLDASKESDYTALVAKCLNSYGIVGGYTLGRLKGCCIYGKTIGNGRKCMTGRWHKNNNFIVEFMKSGDIVYCCFGNECRSTRVTIGQWVNELFEMLDSHQFEPTDDPDSALLHNLYMCAVKMVPKKQKMEMQDWFPKYEQVVVRYLSKYFVFVSKPSVYVKQSFRNGELYDHDRYSSNSLKDIVKPYGHAFNVWDTSHLRDSLGTKTKFVGQPWDVRVAPDEYNLCSGMMPLLKVARRHLTAAEVAEIQPLLDHIKHALCSGVEEDYQHFMEWVAHVMKHPELKTGWCPVFISTQGIGKGLILSGLLGGIFDELGLHVTNFEGVVGR